MGIGGDGGAGGAGGAGGNVGPLFRLVYWGSGHCGGLRAGSVACLGACDAWLSGYRTRLVNIRNKVPIFWN
jgi:hypothetical protein